MAGFDGGWLSTVSIELMIVLDTGTHSIGLILDPTRLPSEAAAIVR